MKGRVDGQLESWLAGWIDRRGRQADGRMDGGMDGRNGRNGRETQKSRWMAVAFLNSADCSRTCYGNITSIHVQTDT